MKKFKRIIIATLIGLIFIGSTSNIYASDFDPVIDLITVDLISMQQPEGGDKIAIKIYANSCDNVEKAEVYRSTSENGSYTKIGTTASDLVYYDLNVSMRKTYYYYMVPIAYDGTKGSPCYAAESKTVDILRPTFKVKSMKKNIVLALPAYDFYEDMKYIEIADKVYGSGIEIYRSTTFDGKYKKIATVTNDTQTFTDKTAKKGTPYFYKIKTYYKDPATGKTYRSAFSEVCFARKGDDNSPSAKAVKLKAVYKNGNIKITWKNPKGFKPYLLIYEYNSDPASDYYTKHKDIDLKKNATSYTIKKAKKNADYYILFCFQDSKTWKCNKYSSFNRCTDYYRIHVNTGINRNLAINNEITSISYDATKNVLTNTQTITWTPVYGAKSYTISLCDYDDNIISTKTLDSSKTSCKISRSLVLSEYCDTFYKIKFAVTNGTKSEELYSANRLALDFVYPKDITVTKASSGAKISWADQSTKGASAYKVYRYSFGGGYTGFKTDTMEEGYLVGETKDTTIMDTALKNSGTYYYVVVPYNDSCSSYYLTKLREYGKQFKY